MHERFNQTESSVGIYCNLLLNYHLYIPSGLGVNHCLNDSVNVMSTRGLLVTKKTFLLVFFSLVLLLAAFGGSVS